MSWERELIFSIYRFVFIAQELGGGYLFPFVYCGKKYYKLININKENYDISISNKSNNLNFISIKNLSFWDINKQKTYKK